MTGAELLQATGNIWRVVCWSDGNRRRRTRVVFCRCADVLRAEEIGRRQSGVRCVDARPWNPETDRSVFGWVSRVD